MSQQSADQNRVIFMPSGKKGTFPTGTKVRDAARAIGEGIESICGGKASCGKCRVRILDGTFSEDGLDMTMGHILPASGQHGIDSRTSHVAPATPTELGVAERYQFKPGDRVSCQAEIQGDLVVFVPEECRVGRAIVVKGASDRAIDVNPTIRKFMLTPEPASLENPIGDWERVQNELEKVVGLTNLTVDFHALAKLREALLGVPGDKSTKGQITITVWDDREVIRFEPGHRERSFGVAVDLGTTTVAAYLCDLATGEHLATESMMNPQIEYGEDVMTRIASSQGEENLRAMQRCIVDGIAELIEKMVLQVGIATDDICDVALGANTAMHHIFLGIDAQALGKHPFNPAISAAVNVKARELGLGILPSAYVYVLPIEAGFVGADNVAVLIAEEPHRQDEVVLIIDIGTNGELALGNSERMYSTSCPTGPALEGASIKYGMRAAPGAIEKIRIDPKTLEVKYRLIGKTQWSNRMSPDEIGALGLCGSAIIDGVAQMVQCGLVEQSGAMAMKQESPRLRRIDDKVGTPEFVIAWADETAIGEDITITLDDVRAIQLAKAAVYAGAECMLLRFGKSKPDKVVLAGAFGSVIDRKSALMIGLFQDCGLKNTSAVGNAAGDGTRMALLDQYKRREAEDIARKVEYIELTAEPTFMQAFVDSTLYPHKEHAFPSVPKPAWALAEADSDETTGTKKVSAA